MDYNNVPGIWSKPVYFLQTDSEQDAIWHTPTVPHNLCTAHHLLSDDHDNTFLSSLQWSSFLASSSKEPRHHNMKNHLNSIRVYVTPE